MSIASSRIATLHLTVSTPRCRECQSVFQLHFAVCPFRRPVNPTTVSRTGGNAVAKLTTKKRKSLSSKSFVFPKSRKFPIEDKAHARDALSRAAHKGGSVEEKVKAAVHKKYPGIGKKSSAPKSKAAPKRRPAKKAPRRRSKGK
jgi:hypothetical protein